jgi:formylglycine-generating enzyme required for sulfatase activity
MEGLPMGRQISLAVAAALVAMLIVVHRGPSLERAAAEEVKVDPRNVMFYPPEDPAQWADWREALHRWRAETAAAINYDDSLYRRADLGWTRQDFTCAFVMLWDETWWDWRGRRFTPERFLEDGLARFGGYDSVVLWHAYPRIGFDQRNQFDFYRDLPSEGRETCPSEWAGGLAGLRKLSQYLHSRGVKVFLDYNPWDTGTRRETQDDLTVLAGLVEAMQADGIFLDTLAHGAAELRQLLDAARKGVALESELPLPLGHVHNHHLSWAQWDRDIHETGPVGVARDMWFERRHLHHFIRRWNTDHTAELHAAWLNGAGMLVWENVFGQLRTWSPRDQSILRAMAPIQRRFAGLFSGGQWTPLVPTLAESVYASQWQSGGVRLWTLANRAQGDVEGALLQVAHRQGDHYYDLIDGRPVTPRIDGGRAVFRGRIRARGVGAMLAGRQEKLGEDFQVFLARQRALPADFSPATSTPSEKMRELKWTMPYTPATLPPDMVAIPGGRFEMEVTFTQRECGQYQTPLRRTVDLRPFAVDAVPVTNAHFARFLREANYKPKQPENFLKHWVDGQPPTGKEDHPVVYVDLEDARAYAAWAGKRLPTEEEWQYAAGGPQGLAYPWGNRFDPARCNHGQSGNTTTPVRAFPDGRSPLGVYDMCGNTWEWTESERSDGRTRFCVIKGGSFFKAQGSHWYADGGPQPTQLAAKFLMMWPGLDRCGTIGFRCAVDMKDQSRK